MNQFIAVGTPGVTWVHFFPIGTTLIAAVFSFLLFRRYLTRTPSIYLLWWAIGIACYGLGTLAESLITLTGNTVFLNKFWYITGALLGGYPLAQGSIYLLQSRRFANIATAISLPFVIMTSVLVAMSPVLPEVMESYRPTGAILGWKWIRMMTPFINTYAVIFLIGGAAVSSRRYFKSGKNLMQARGNALIAFGALMPGIGGSLAKAGYVESLYVLEFLGLILIWIGDRLCGNKS